jgi:anaerobic nitric oxide reductase transcription regulator
MTANPLLETLIPLVADLSRELDDDERYRRLLAALRQLFPCDAVALLRLDGEILVPLAVEGLSASASGCVAGARRTDAFRCRLRPA